MTTAMQKYRADCASFFRQLFVGEDRVLVFGTGNGQSPRLMLIGEAPGEQETLEGQPFVGKAGKNLDAFLGEIGLLREQLYITNAVKVRPTKVSAAGRVINRPPSSEEMALFEPWLKREIGLVAPGLIATLGNVPLRALTGKPMAIGTVHGQALSIPGISAPIFPLYHPASVIYNPKLKGTYAQDLQVLRTLLNDI